MKRCLVMVFSLAIIAVSCSRGVSHIETHSLPSPNPTNYTFSLPLEELYVKALQAFSVEHQVANPIFSHGTSSAPLEGMQMLFPECATNAAFGEAIFRDPANTNDVYLSSMDSPFVHSPIYFGKKGGLPFIASFHLHLTGSGSNTTVSVIAADAEVINGTKFGFGPCGPGQGNNYVRVQPTTVEEYSLLRYLGDYLGVTNMPPLILPNH